MNKEYLQRAIELSQASLDAGEFSSGAVLVSKNGNVYESGPTRSHLHGEMMVIDAAVEEEGLYLYDSIIYTSMEPCLMCCAKMYWAGVERVEFVIPKSRLDQRIAFENDLPIEPQIESFYKKLELVPRPELVEEALAVWEEWYKKNVG